MTAYSVWPRELHTSLVACSRLLRQLLAIESGLPIAAKARDELRVLGLLLSVEILQLTSDFNHAESWGRVRR